jgi:DNA-binding MarR family transcriptional regulator
MNRNVIKMKNRRRLIENIFENFYAIRQKIASELNLSFDEMQLTYSQWLVLNLVRKNKSINIKDLAELLGITSSAATQIVDGLVNKGLLSRKRSKIDRRVLEIALFKKSINRFRRGMNKISLIFDVLDDDELLKFCELNSKIAAKETDIDK